MTEQTTRTVTGKVYGWRSGERTRLPPMWAGFDFGKVPYSFLFVLSCSEAFSSITPVILRSQKPTSQFDQDKGPTSKPAKADVASFLNCVIYSNIYYPLFPHDTKTIE